MSILSKLAQLQAKAEKFKISKVTVTFKDGHKEYMSIGECIEFWRSDRYREAERFEGKGHGVLPDLFTSGLKYESEDT